MRSFAYIFMVASLVGCGSSGSTEAANATESEIDATKLTAVEPNEREATDSKVASADTSMTRFSVFSDPVKYAELVHQAESGDKESLGLLISYFSYPRYPDLRNLLYWSDKQFSYLGPEAYTNYILALSENSCDQAWRILEEKYQNIKDFDFYYRLPEGESIDGKCLRKAE